MLKGEFQCFGFDQRIEIRGSLPVDSTDCGLASVLPLGIALPHSLVAAVGLEPTTYGL